MTRYTKYNAETGKIEFTFGGHGGDLEINKPYIEGEYSGEEYIVVDGKPVKKNIVEIEEFRINLAWDEFRNRRKSRLSGCDWTQSPDSPLNEDQKIAWAKYRQELRNLTDNITDPRYINWPDIPKLNNEPR